MSENVESVEVVKEENALELIQKMTPVEVFKDGHLKVFLSRVREESLKLVPDVTTKKGREEIASAAYKVARTKTFIDKAGLALGEDLRAQLEVINKERSLAKTECEKIQEEIRRPLDAWEAEEKKRLTNIETEINFIQSIGNDVQANHLSMSMDDLKEKYNQIKENKFDFQEMADKAEGFKNSALLKIRDGMDALKVHLEEQEKARLKKAEDDRIAAEKAEKERLEREAKIAAEAAEKARLDAEEKFKREAQAEKDKADAELKRVQKEKEDAEAREREVKLKAERDAALAKEAAAKAERDAQERERLAAEKAKAEQKAKEEKEKADQEKRENSLRIVKKAHNNILDVLVKSIPDLTKDQAIEVVKLIATKQLPGVNITY